MSNDQPQEEAPPMVVLTEEYETAFLGHDVSVNQLPRAVYSLFLLTSCEMQRLDCDEEKAQSSVAALVQAVTDKHKDDAPIFVDDAVTRVKKEKPRIITPPAGTFLN